MKQRNLDPCFFDIERDNKICKVCVSDMTYAERAKVLSSLSKADLLLLINRLADATLFLGDTYDLIYEEVEK